ncbi:MAG: KAP family NTPase, partial [Treponemataceae bacterium]|nr:KAP family NTPase [Treponemataceae bacterium]
MTDLLSRHSFIELLKNIIANQSANKSEYSIAIDGGWGCGKTWVLQELETQLENPYLTFHYNAWENDFYEEPLVAILSVMIDSLQDLKTVNEAGGKEKVISKAVSSLLKIAGTITEKRCDINISDALESIKETGTAVSDKKLEKSDFNTLMPLSNALSKIKDTMLEISETYKLVLVIDELDRCLPEYAIKVLERIHHICNGIPIVQIIAIDKSHLADSICKVFGKNFDKQNPRHSMIQFVDSYLQKFIDVTIPLNAGNIAENDLILNGIEKEYKPYIRKDFQLPICVDYAFLHSFVATIMKNIDRRMQEKIFAMVATCHKLTIDSGANIEHCTYAILIYEILSCINMYVFHSLNTYSLIKYNDETFCLAFSTIEHSLNLFTEKYKFFNQNLKEFFKLDI